MLCWIKLMKEYSDDLPIELKQELINWWTIWKKL